MMYESGRWRIRTADPLLVRQMLWTSWAKRPLKGFLLYAFALKSGAKIRLFWLPPNVLAIKLRKKWFLCPKRPNGRLGKQFRPQPNPLFVAPRGNNGRLARKAAFLGGKGRLAHAWKMATQQGMFRVTRTFGVTHKRTCLTVNFPSWVGLYKR